MRTRPPHAKRRGFPSRGGTFFRLLAKMTPPGGRLKELVILVCELHSSHQHNSRRGQLLNNMVCMTYVQQFDFLSKYFLCFVSGAWDIGWKLVLSLPQCPPKLLRVCKPILLLQFNSIYHNQKYNHRCTSLRLQIRYALAKFHQAKEAQRDYVTIRGSEVNLSNKNDIIYCFIS